MFQCGLSKEDSLRLSIKPAYCCGYLENRHLISDGYSASDYLKANFKANSCGSSSSSDASLKCSDKYQLTGQLNGRRKSMTVKSMFGNLFGSKSSRQKKKRPSLSIWDLQLQSIDKIECHNHQYHWIIIWLSFDVQIISPHCKYGWSIDRTNSIILFILKNRAASSRRSKFELAVGWKKLFTQVAHLYIHWTSMGLNSSKFKLWTFWETIKKTIKSDYFTDSEYFWFFYNWSFRVSRWLFHFFKFDPNPLLQSSFEILLFELFCWTALS